MGAAVAAKANSIKIGDVTRYRRISNWSRILWSNIAVIPNRPSRTCTGKVMDPLQRYWRPGYQAGAGYLKGAECDLSTIPTPFKEAQSNEKSLRIAMTR